MKKFKCLILLVMVSFFATGCIKFNANMDIKKDKSMDFSIIYAFDSSLFGNQELLDDKDKKELEEQGFAVDDYKEDKMEGFKISRNIKNIDVVSSTGDTSYSLSGILDEKSDNKYIFKVKKGVIKNTYIAKFNFNTNDSNLSGADDSSDSTSEDNSTTLNDWPFTSDDGGELNSNVDSNSDFDLSGVSSNLDLSFNVTLPYSAKSSNATSTNNDNKSLKWSLSSNEAENIEFVFELYNITTICIGLGILILVIATIVVFIIRKKKLSRNGIIAKTNSDTQISNNNVMEQTTPGSTVNMQVVNQTSAVQSGYASSEIQQSNLSVNNNLSNSTSVAQNSQPLVDNSMNMQALENQIINPQFGGQNTNSNNSQQANSDVNNTPFAN